MTTLSLAFDLRSPDFGPPTVELYQACLDMCEWADKLGFESVSFMEHHGSPDGYLPSPMIMAAAAAGRTRNCIIEMSLMVVTLYHPLKAAEDLAVLDLAANGRLRMVLGAGYRPEEFEQFGLDFKKRPSRMENAIETLKKAWTGEPFEFEGRTVTIRPRPAQRPRPKIIMGGSSQPAAERAARIADGFHGSPKNQPFFDAKLAELGKPPFEDKRVKCSYFLLYVAKDVEAAWEKVGPHALHVNNAYSEWQVGNPNPPFRHVAGIPELKKAGVLKIVTPEECVELVKREGGMQVQPLFGGLPPALGWESLKLIETEVLPKVR